MITFKLPGAAVELIHDRSWCYSPDCPEGPAAHATYRAIMSAPWVKAGFGRRYTVTAPRDGVEKLLSYLESLAGLYGIATDTGDDGINQEARIAATAARSVRKALA